LNGLRGRFIIDIQKINLIGLEPTITENEQFAKGINWTQNKSHWLSVAFIFCEPLWTFIEPNIS